MHACDAAREGSVEGGVRHLKTGFWPARRFGCLPELDEQYARWRDQVCNRRVHATGRFPVWERLAHEREVLRPLPPTSFDFAGARPVRVGLDGYLKLGGNFYRAPLALVHQRVELRFDRDQVWICHAGETVASYRRSNDQGQWFPPPQLRPEPPAAAPIARLAVRTSRHPSSPTTPSSAHDRRNPGGERVRYLDRRTGCTHTRVQALEREVPVLPIVPAA